MQKRRYEKPEVEIIAFEEIDDVITMSNQDSGSGGSTAWDW